MKNKNLRPVGSAGGIELEKKDTHITDNLYRSIKIIIDKARNDVLWQSIPPWWKLTGILADLLQRMNRRVKTGRNTGNCRLKVFHKN